MKKIFKRNYKKILILSSLMIILSLNFITFGNIINENVYFNNYDDETNEFFQNDSIRSQDYFEQHFDNIEWLKNNTFDHPVTEWYNTTEGDTSDVNASLSPGVANYEVMGDQYIFSNISGTPQAGDWADVFNPYFPIKPDTYIINEEGCRIEHTWNEWVNQTRNTPSARWKRNIEMPVNMSDYIITSASLNATFNASVVPSPESNGIEIPADGVIPTGIGDYARFYVLISDLNGTHDYQVAFNQTRDLGQDDPEISYYAETLMNNIPEDVLIAFLTSALSYDNFNFSVILGIDLYCEDNIPGVDIDIWNYLIIREVNLTFTCQKKIDKFTSVSWCQDGDKISGTNAVIKNATLNFKYKIDQNWTESSPNSEIRILINNLLHSETIKLSKANTSFQEANFDLASLIPTNQNINTTIQLYLADTFSLDRKFNISIDDVYLKISYKITIIGEETDFVLFLNGENKTLGKFLKVPYGDTINITMKYIDLSRDFIPNADVTLTGLIDVKDLNENSLYEHYNITIGTNLFSLGEHVFTLYAYKEGYNPQKISLSIDLVERETYEDFFLNQINKTFDKTMELPINDNLNITFKYFDAKTNNYINNATVQLIGTDIPLNLIEYPQLQYYSLNINTKDLDWDVQYLTIIAEKTNYQPSLNILKIKVRQIKTNISVISGEVVNIGVGGSHLLNITIYDIDHNVSLTNATVRFSGDLGEGVLIEDPDNPGTYQASFENIGLGTYRIAINVTDSSGYYLFEDKEVTLSGTISEGEAMIFLVSLIASIIAAITIGSYFIAYQRYLKYPKPVRKVHKFKRTLKRKSTPSVDIISRDDSFKSLHKEGLGKVSRLKPGKLEEDKLPSVDIKSEAKFEEKPPTPEKIPEVKPKEKPKATEKKDKKKGKIKLSKDKAKKKEQSTETK